VCCRSYPGEKRRKQTQATLTYLLEEADINDDLRIINKTLAQAKQPASPATQSAGKHRTVVPPHGFDVPGIIYLASTSVFLIRFHLIRILIWIQHFVLNADPNPDPIRIQGFDDQKFKKNYS
jgi:hypothetical protein